MEIGMTDELAIHGFDTSNNFKVRIALGYKKIPYTYHKIDPADRSGILRISGQHLTPVMVHGDRVLFDSAAILRYLDANFPATPKLYGKSFQDQWAIEDLETFARFTLASPMTSIVHHRKSGGTVDEAMQSRAQAAFSAAATELAERLGGRPWLVGDAMTAADITAAAVIFRVRAAKMFTMPELSDNLWKWVDKVTAFDQHLPKA